MSCRNEIQVCKSGEICPTARKTGVLLFLLYGVFRVNSLCSYLLLLYSTPIPPYSTKELVIEREWRFQFTPASPHMFTGPSPGDGICLGASPGLDSLDPCYY